MSHSSVPRTATARTWALMMRELKISSCDGEANQINCPASVVAITRLQP
jgi:hypothetical protein